MQKTIYLAAPLFKGSDSFFNIHLAEKLEKKGFRLFVPQRDGFEFGKLADAIKGKLTSEEIQTAVHQIIYYLDMGKFIPKSDIVSANLDEPLDEGVITEITFSNFIGKYVVGYRTDIRSPYGNPSSRLGGMHFFPAFQCDTFLRYSMPCKSATIGKSQLEKLASAIAGEMQNVKTGKMPNYVKQNPHVKSILDSANLLFDGIKDIHSEKGLTEICTRYLAYRDKLEKLYPKTRYS